MFMPAASPRKPSRPNPQPVADLPGQPSNTDRAKKRLDTAPPRDPVELLETLGEALHGAYWMGPTARDLDVKHTTLVAWVSGKSRFRDGPVLDALRLLVKSHTQAVAKARALGKGKPT
jgi:hypothetical protein